MISNISNIFSFYEEIGATARAKNEALTARAMFVSGVMEQSYRLWLTLLTTEMTEAVHAAQELSSCTSPIEVAEVQRAWLHASSARAITSLQGTIEISNFLIKNIQETLTATAPIGADLLSGRAKPKALTAPVAAAIAAPVQAALTAVTAAAAPLPVVPAIAAPVQAPAPEPVPVVVAEPVSAPAPEPVPVVVAEPVSAPAPTPAAAAADPVVKAAKVHRASKSARH
jgi:hypothetical protein